MNAWHVFQRTERLIGELWEEEVKKGGIIGASNSNVCVAHLFRFEPMPLLVRS